MTAPSSVEDREPFDRLLGELRPKLHRYCARMIGSAIDADDVVQEAAVKALEARPEHGPIANIEGWLFRIAHNAALDYLRRRARQDVGRESFRLGRPVDLSRIIEIDGRAVRRKRRRSGGAAAQTR